MAGPEGISRRCSQCGAWNHPGATVCFLCDHRLRPPGPEAKAEGPGSPPSPAPTGPVKPYEAPTTLPASGLSFRLSSLLLVIAVTAVCLGVVQENQVLGIILTVAATPALVYTTVVAGRRQALGTPMSNLEKVATFMASLLGVVVIAVLTVVSAFIALFVTCIATLGGGGPSLTYSIAAGVLAAVVALAWTTRHLLALGGRTREFKRDT
jgi:hypothetical protein